MLTLSSGYSPDYLLKEIATGRENYYTGAVTDGEPPGRWWGAGAEALGLTGLVDAQDMRAVYERYLDPRYDAFADPSRWDEAATLGHTGRRYATEDELYAVALEREPDASAERRAEFRVEAGKSARRPSTTTRCGPPSGSEVNRPATSSPESCQPAPPSPAAR